MAKRKTALLVLFVFILACVLTGAWETVKCTGGAYVGHPGLVAECLHQQTVNHNNAYPAPGEPYPVPATPEPPVITPLFTVITPQAPLPTWPPNIECFKEPCP
jgi:hypothetical protein